MYVHRGCISQRGRASIPADYIWRRPTHATPIASFMLAHAEAARLRACEGNSRSVRSTPPSRWLTWVLPVAAARLLERQADRDRCRRPYVRYANCAFRQIGQELGLQVAARRLPDQADGAPGKGNVVARLDAVEILEEEATTRRHRLPVVLRFQQLPRLGALLRVDDAHGCRGVSRSPRSPSRCAARAYSRARPTDRAACRRGARHRRRQAAPRDGRKPRAAQASTTNRPRCSRSRRSSAPRHGHSSTRSARAASPVRCGDGRAGSDRGSSPRSRTRGRRSFSRCVRKTIAPAACDAHRARRRSPRRQADPRPLALWSGFR